MSDTNKILRNVLYEIATIYSEKGGQTLRKMADELYGDPHVLLTAADCDHKFADSYLYCNICFGGLAVCKVCKKSEAELDGPCIKRDLTGIHDSRYCNCETCAWARYDNAPFPELPRYDFSEQQRGEQ